MVANMGTAAGTKERHPPSETLIIRLARFTEIPAYMAEAYGHASPRVKAAISLETAIARVQEHGLVNVVTDILGNIIGGVVLITDAMQAPRICWAYLDKKLWGSRLAQTMTSILVAQHVVMSDGSEIRVTSLTGAHQIRAERALMSMGFIAQPFVCEAVEDEHGSAPRLADRGPAIWTLEGDQLTAAIEVVQNLTLRQIWVLQSGPSATVMFLHPVITDSLLHEDLVSIIAARR